MATKKAADLQKQIADLQAQLQGELSQEGIAPPAPTTQDLLSKFTTDITAEVNDLAVKGYPLLGQFLRAFIGNFLTQEGTAFIEALHKL